MKDLKIPATKFTPEVTGNTEQGELVIKGVSYPENADEFYRVIFLWIDEYFQSDFNSMTLHFELNYFNTATSRYFYTLFDKLEEKVNAGNKVKLIWYYRSEDPDMLESGEEALLDVKLDYSFVAI